ncbi:MAG: helix-turn-helix transcriptional regulator [Faecalibacterium sp.]|nr:helix-turn-helix transcriptional regulator [Ruminococcus sp.]MCM1391475.1 helix-turn-helix transcriptional regulator [Ruminococcus sp.]MCM1485267.1 helix-turn-helix transcriptional regulator [Faecalibacterium sp.]
MMNEQYGEVALTLNEMIDKSGLSKNKIAFKAEIQRTQLNNYCKGKIQRIDLDVLARLCYVLECTPGDLLEYHAFILSK